MIKDVTLYTKVSKNFLLSYTINLIMNNYEKK